MRFRSDSEDSIDTQNDDIFNNCEQNSSNHNDKIKDKFTYNFRSPKILYIVNLGICIIYLTEYLVKFFIA